MTFLMNENFSFIYFIIIDFFDSYHSDVKSETKN